jgi:hypothetical protein
VKEHLALVGAVVPPTVRMDWVLRPPGNAVGLQKLLYSSFLEDEGGNSSLGLSAVGRMDRHQREVVGVANREGVVVDIRCLVVEVEVHCSNLLASEVSFSNAAPCRYWSSRQQQAMTI